MGVPRSEAARRLGVGDTRRSLRVPVSIDAWMSGSAVRKHLADLADISVDGCRVHSPFQLEPGRPVVLRIDGLQPMLALVRWCTEREVGLQFTRSLDPRVVRRVCEQSLVPSRAP